MPKKDQAEIEKVSSPSSEIVLPDDVQAFYRENAQEGSQNLSMALPLLKITESNSDNIGVDGNTVLPGWFYYAPTQEAIKELAVSVLTISRGFYALDNDKKGPKPKFHQIMAGVILQTGAPFLMFVTGTRLSNMWDFGRTIAPMVRNRKAPIPMMAFKVHLVLEKIKTNFGSNHIIKLDLIKTDDGVLDLETDIQVLTKYKAHLANLEGMINSFIQEKEVDKQTGEPVSKVEKLPEPEDELDDFPDARSSEDKLTGDPKKDMTEDVNPEDVPF